MGIITECHGKNAVAAAKQYGVKASHILGILHAEGGTAKGCKPVKPRDGLGNPSFGQFTFGTAQMMGVTVGDSKSEVDGIARYLIQLGYKSDPTKAIAAYNGGPNNPQYGYAAKVRAFALSYIAYDRGKTDDPWQEDGSYEQPTSSPYEELTGQESPLSGLEDITKVFQKLTTKSTWKSVGLVSVGGVMMTAAVLILAAEFMKKVPSPVKAVIK